ncbi:MAG: flavin reductase family protein [Anaerolineae bacterium]|nr:flavin reductase family protein [Anaerolineae bacterium]
MADKVDPDDMRNTLRLWASGVSVVTSSAGNERNGLTVSAFNSLSLEPPLILVCLHKDSSTIPVIEESGVFAVSILNANQEHLSDRFAGRIPLEADEDRFTGVEAFTAVTGAPLLKEAIGWLDCRVHLRHDGSTHWIYIGEVVATGWSATPHDPLLYFDRNYRSIVRESISE